MYKLVAIFILCAFGCATTKTASPVISVDRQWELEELPPDPATDDLSRKFPGGNWVEVQEVGDCITESGDAVEAPCPKRAGIVFSEEKAARAQLYKTRYVELRKTTLADRKITAAQREYYEARLELARKEIERLQPTWWSEHKAEIAGLGMFALGIATTLAVVAADREVSGD